MPHAHSWTYFYVPGDAFRYCSCGARESVDPDGKSRPVTAKERGFVEGQIKKLEKKGGLRTKSFGSLTFRVDRPKGTVKTWKRPDGSVKSFTYPVDYGYLPGYKAEDGEGLDFFIGDDPKGHLESFQKLHEGVLDETKFLVGVTDAERETIYTLYGPEIWHRRTYRNMDELTARLPHFHATRKPRYVMEFGRFGNMEKDAGVLDSIKGFFGRGRGAPLPHVAPHAVPHNFPKTQEWTEHGPTIIPPEPQRARTTGNFPVETPSRNTGNFHVEKLPHTRVSHPAPSPEFTMAPDHTPAPKSTTPLRHTAYGDMLMDAPGMQETIKKDLRARVALGAHAPQGGRFTASRTANANTLGAHMLQHAPGERISPELLHSMMSSPVYAQARQSFKGASARRRGKIAMLESLGFKAADSKFADITKALTGEVLMADTQGVRGAFGHAMPATASPGL